MATALPTVRWNHDWVAVDLGNGRGLSASYGGSKGRGAVPAFLFDAWSELAGTIKVAPGLTPKVRKLLDECTGATFKDKVAAFVARIPAMWPEWNVPPKTYKPGQDVRFDFGKRRGGMDTGKVESVSRGTVWVRWVRSGVVGLKADMLDQYN